MNIIDKAYICYKEGDIYNFPIYSKWLKPLFSTIFVPYCKFINSSGNEEEKYVKEFFLSLYFSNIDKYINSGMFENVDIILYSLEYHRTLTGQSILNYVGNKYIIGDYTYVHNINLDSMLKSKSFMEKIEVEDEFYLKWNKIYGSRDNALQNYGKPEPKSCIKDYGFFDKYYIIRQDIYDTTFHTTLNQISSFSVLTIQPGNIYMLNNLFSIGPNEINIIPDYGLNIPDWYVLKRYNKNMNYYSFWNDTSNIYVYSDKTDGKIRCLICLFPIFNNGMITKRLIYDITQNIFGESTVFCVEHNDFLAGINPPSELINGMYNKIILGLIDQTLFETRIDPLCMGMFGILGSVDVTFNPNNMNNPEFVYGTLNTTSFNLKFIIQPNTFDNSARIFAYNWKRDNHFIDKFNIIEKYEDNVGVPLEHKVSINIKYLFPYLLKNTKNNDLRKIKIKINSIDCGEYKFIYSDFKFN